MDAAYKQATGAASAAIKPAVQGVLPLIPDEVAGIKLKDPITTWWTELHAKQGACEQCSLTVLYTLIEFMCLMTVPTVVGALLVLFAAFAPAAANMAIGVMEEKVGLVAKMIPPVIPAPVVGPAIYVLFSFVLPMAPVIGGFCPLILTILMIAFGGKNIMSVTLSNASSSATPAPASEKASVAEAVKAAANGDAKEE